MKNLQNPTTKKTSSAILIAISAAVFLFGTVQVAGPNYEAGMVVMLFGGLTMTIGMLTRKV